MKCKYRLPLLLFQTELTRNIKYFNSHHGKITILYPFNSLYLNEKNYQINSNEKSNSPILLLTAVFSLNACQKKGDTSNPQELLVTWEKEKPSNTQTKQTITESVSSEEDEEIEDDGQGTIDLCAQNGGTVRVRHSWILATCKSNCTKGIGFRCGGYDYIECKNGVRFYIDGSLTNRCPVSVINPNATATIRNEKKNLSTSGRDMQCRYQFYSDNTLKIIFEKAIPKEESETNELDIEVDDLFKLHQNIRIGGKRYKGYQVQIGKYKINKKDGKFGSVIIPIKLIP